MDTNLTGLSSINNHALTSYASTAARAADATNLRGRLENTDRSTSKEELMSACKDFEAYFMEQIFKEMYASVEAINPDSETSTADSLISFYRDKTFSDIANTAVETRGTGLAQELYKNMSRNLGISADEIPLKDGEKKGNTVADTAADQVTHHLK